nr:class B sortase [uncultured Acetatifactor sp.]
MEKKIYTLEGRQFRTESDYANARRDKEIIDKLRKETDFGDRGELTVLRKKLNDGQYKFRTLLGRDFLDEVEEQLKKIDIAEGRRRPVRTRQETAGEEVRTKGEVKADRSNTDSRRMHVNPGRAGRPEGQTGRDTEKKKSSQAEENGIADAIVQEELEKLEKRRKLILALCSAAAVCCLGYFGIYSYYIYRTESAYQKLSEMKEMAASSAEAVTPSSEGPLYTLDGEAKEKEVLEEYKNLLLKNRKLIGWVKIDGTSIDYPVMQTVDNEYYLDHNMNQEYDKNGTIFMDKDCDVLKPSTNYILYGHHMRSGKMFGQLDKYKDEAFCEEHPYISFDTIYEKGTYEVMYVFRSKVYKETEIAFKYYQFIDANGEQEFDSYMQEMAALSLYDTGVTAAYGDQLLTLSTCDYQETDGRFVVVAKKVE